MSLAMSPAERENFLADMHVGVLSIPDGDRGPLSAPIWYDYTPGGELWMIIGTDSRKARALRSAQRVSLVAQQEAMPYRYVSVEGTVVSQAPCAPGELLAMAQRYLGPEQGQAYADASSGNSYTVRVRPERWLTVDYGKMGA
ncbi:MAG: pyridoxamine 5'-phosphate oxidase family protein [Pseudomonadota bacterium]